MLRIDFGQTFEDHRSILVLVKKLGSVKEDEFSQLFEDISQLRTVDLPDSRTVHLRYTRHISHQFVDWGSFHTHKKLLGILSIARCSPDKDLASIQTAHESLKTWYSNTSLDSRCFLLGYSHSGENASGEEMKKQMREFVFLGDDNLLEEIKRQVAEYALSLFLVLEGKRMDKSLEKPDKMLLLRSPLDSDAPIDGENRNRKQCIGRMKKYIGDLCLVAGVPQEAIFHYSVAMDFLRSIGDSLWLCGSVEGLCAASLLFRSGKGTSSLERPSLQLNVDQLSTAGPVNGIGGDGEDVRIGSALPLTDEEIVEKADEIFQVYGRHKDSKVLGVEARFKYARFFVKKKLYKEASNVLQDVLSIELNLSDAEKIQQYSAMSIMYEDIGFARKAAFFTRMAAMNCTSQHLPLQGWTASYNLLRNALEGYKIYFDKQATGGKNVGWPELQVILMQELIKMSEELQNPEIPIRHISYLLHTMYKHMSDSAILRLITSLENLGTSPEHYTLIDNLVLANGDHLPPVVWTDFPVVRKLKVNVLASHLRPFVSPTSPLKTPFIFSMLNKKPGKHKKHSPIVNWVEGEVGEVAMQVCNPMPFDVKVSKMTLLTEGVQFKAFPSCLALSNDGMSHPFMLLGIPESPGQLRITGYSVELFGIQSNCPISETILDNPLDLPLLVNVAPRLPQVQFQSSIPNIKSSVNSSHRGSALFLEVLVYTGQTIAGPIVVENVGSIPVENLTSSILSTFKSEHGNIVEMKEDHLSVMPLQPNSKTYFDLTFNGILGPNDGDNFTWKGKIKVSYSGGAACSQGMSRQAVIDISVDVIRSLQCSVVDIQPVKSNEQHFQLVIDVQNQTTRDFEWHYEVNQETISARENLSILPPNEKTRTCIVLEKLDLSKVENERSDCDRCAEILSELVTIHWRIIYPDLKVSGMFNLGPFHIDEETVNILRKYSLTFEIKLNGVNVGKDEVLTTQASCPVILTVKATNCTDYDVKPTILNIEPYEVNEDGVDVFEVKSKICWLGSTSTILPKIDVGGSAEHTCGFLFLCPGRYFVNVRCFEKASLSENGQAFRGRAHVIKSDSPSNVHRTRNSRSESFTDSLLLRQRSFSTPLAMLAHSAVIRVVDDTDENSITHESACVTEHKTLGEIQEVPEDVVDPQCHRVDGHEGNNSGVSIADGSENSRNETLNQQGVELPGDEINRFVSNHGTQCVESDRSLGNTSHCLTEETNVDVPEEICRTRGSTDRDGEGKLLNEYSNEESAREVDVLEANRITNDGGQGEIDKKDNNVFSETNAQSCEDVQEECTEKLSESLQCEANKDINDSPGDDESNENDREIVRSPSIQERIMFFNTNS